MRRQGEGGSQSDSRRGWNRGTKEYYFGWVKVATNIRGKESIVHVASVWEMEHHHPTMSTLEGHGYRSKRKKRKIVDHLYHPPR